MEKIIKSTMSIYTNTWRMTLCICLLLATICTPSHAGDQPYQVTATHLPLWSMAQAIAGPHAQVTVLVPPGADLHSFSMRPGDIKRIATADLILLNGAGLEAAISRALISASNTVDTSAGLTLISPRKGTPNPHVWLDPIYAIHQVHAVRDALIRLDPANKATYTRNAASVIDELKGLDALARELLTPIKSTPLVTYHDAFSYMASRYGLTPFPLSGLHGTTPLAGRMRQAYDLIRTHKVKAVFYEEQYPEDALLRIKRDLGVELCRLDTLTTGEMEETLYLTGMRRNIQSIARCLASGNE